MPTERKRSVTRLLPRWAAVAGLAACLGIVGCTSNAMPPRGVSLDDLGLTATPLLSMAEIFPETEGPHHVLELGTAPETPGELRIVSSHGVAWVDPFGHLLRWVAFEGPDFLFPAGSMTLKTGDMGFVGLVGDAFTAGGGQGRVVIFGADGEIEQQYSSGYASHFLATDLSGDPAAEIVVESARGTTLTAYDLENRQLWVSETDVHVSALEAVERRDGGARAVAVYLYPVDDAAEVRILDGADGKVLDAWPAPVAGGFEASPTRHDQTGLLFLVGEELLIYGLDGELLERLPAPSAGSFADLESRLLPDGRRVTLSTGDGSLFGHMLVVHDREGQMVYRRVERERAYGLEVVTAGSQTTIYYGAGGTVWALRE